MYVLNTMSNSYPNQSLKMKRSQRAIKFFYLKKSNFKCLAPTGYSNGSDIICKLYSYKLVPTNHNSDLKAICKKIQVELDEK